MSQHPLPPLFRKPSQEIEAKPLPSEDVLFDKENPGVYLAFVKEAEAVRASNFTHYSARTIIHVLRHHSAVKDGGETFKINDHISPYLARRLARERPAFATFFEFREAKSA